MNIPFSPPYIDDDIRKEVLDTLDSGWITTGPKVRLLEEILCDRLHVPAALCCNSATSGMMLALHWFGVGEGDEVIIPAYTYAATALVVLHLGATPVMVDVNADLVMDSLQVREKITRRTKAIVPVDVAGWPCSYDELISLVNDSDVKSLFEPEHENQKKLGRIFIMADSAHSIGAVFKGKALGLWADMTVFSFHAVKNITTAEGGAICLNLPQPFNNRELYKQLRLWSLNGQTKDALTKTQGGGWRYDIVYPGFKINMPDICAAIGLVQMRKYFDTLLPQRHKIFQQYLDKFSAFSWAELPALKKGDTVSSGHLFPLRIKGITEQERDSIIELVMERGISVNVHFTPLPALTLFRTLGYKMDHFPVSFDQYSREISLPIYPGLTGEQINYIVDAVLLAYRNVVLERPDDNQISA